MKKLKFIKRLELWWFYLSDEKKDHIDAVLSAIIILAFFIFCIWFGYEAGKAGFGS